MDTKSRKAKKDKEDCHHGSERRPDRFRQKEQNSSVRRQAVRCLWRGTALDGQTVK